MKRFQIPLRRKRFYGGVILLLLIVAGSVLLCIRLERSGRAFHYHGGFSGNGPSDRIDRGKLLQQARESMARHQFEVAQKCVDEILQRSPDDAAAWQLQGAIYYRQENYRQAEYTFRYLLKQHPGNVGGRNNLARTLWRLDRREEAQQEIEAALQLAPENPSVLLTATVFAAEEGDESRAGAYLQRAMQAGATTEAIVRDPRLERLVTQLAERIQNEAAAPAVPSDQNTGAAPDAASGHHAE